MKILILGISGMLGHNLFSNLSKYDYKVFGTLRDKNLIDTFFNFQKQNVYKINFKHDNFNELSNLIERINPDYVINCIGIIKQKNNDNLDSYRFINSELPKTLNDLANKFCFKLIHFSTDCVFKGDTGFYNEKSKPDAEDSYGRSKYLGEVSGPNTLTLRTSIIGHELNSSYSLLEWFLGEKSEIVNGYSNAIFSGLPTVFISEVLHKYVLGNDLNGLYNLAVKPIDKFSLLNKISKRYKKEIVIKKDIDFKINRSLNCEKFIKETGYNYPDWDTLINMMYEDRIKNTVYEKK